MAKQDNRPGENALERTRRLVDRVNERFADPGVDDIRFVDLKLERAGAGCLHYASGQVLFAFRATAELTKLLDGTLQEQVRAIAGQAA